VRVKLADSLFDSSGTLTPEQTQYLDNTEMNLSAQTLNAISIWRTVDRFFPRLHGFKPGDSCDAVEQARNIIGNDTLTVRQIYEDIRKQWEMPNWFPVQLPPPYLIGPQWAIYRWLQLNLLAAIDILKRYPVDIVPKAQKRTNERHDLDYAVTATLIGGLATKDAAMADRFRLLCPTGLLVR